MPQCQQFLTAKPGTEKEANSTESLQSNCSTGEDVVDE